MYTHDTDRIVRKNQDFIARRARQMVDSCQKSGLTDKDILELLISSSRADINETQIEVLEAATNIMQKRVNGE